MEPGRDAEGSRTWGTLCHLAALAGFLGVPFGNLLGPLIVWQVRREADPFADEEGREELNFQLSMSLYGLVLLLVLVALLGGLTATAGTAVFSRLYPAFTLRGLSGLAAALAVGALADLAIMAGLLLFDLLIVLAASVQAWRGRHTRLPLAIRWIH